MWARAITDGCFLMSAQAFYEGHMTEKAENGAGKPVRRQYMFRLPGTRAFLLVVVRRGDRFSVVTTRPHASVAPIHDRMLPVFGSGESSVWLGPDLAGFEDRLSVTLISTSEQRSGDVKP